MSLNREPGRLTTWPVCRSKAWWLPAATRRLSGELDAVAIVLLPGRGDGGLRVGVAVPPGRDDGLDARQELRLVLAVTGGRGGGSAVFAQGGGLDLTDPRAAASRITAAYGRR